MLKNTSDDCQPYAIFSDVINYSVTHLLSYVELFFFFSIQIWNQYYFACIVL